MPTQTNLTGYAGDGPIQAQFQVFYLGSPFNITGVPVQIVLKTSPDLPDPVAPQPGVFNQSNLGISSINGAQGTGTWTIPEQYTNEPGNYWWHGTFNNGGVITTWGFGTLTILAA